MTDPALPLPGSLVVCADRVHGPLGPPSRRLSRQKRGPCSPTG